jgi:hypothetical protein
VSVGSFASSFRELYQREVRRIHLPRTWVNRRELVLKQGDSYPFPTSLQAVVYLR